METLHTYRHRRSVSKSKLTSSVLDPPDHHFAVSLASNSTDRIFANFHDQFVRSGVSSCSLFGVTIGIFRSALCVSQRRLAFHGIVPRSDTSDFYDGWVFGPLINPVVTIHIGVIAVVVISSVCEVIIVVFGVCKPQLVLIWAAVDKFVPCNGRYPLNLFGGINPVSRQPPVDINTEILLRHRTWVIFPLFCVNGLLFVNSVRIPIPAYCFLPLSRVIIWWQGLVAHSGFVKE